MKGLKILFKLNKTLNRPYCSATRILRYQTAKKPSDPLNRPLNRANESNANSLFHWSCLRTHFILSVKVRELQLIGPLQQFIFFPMAILLPKSKNNELLAIKVGVFFSTHSGIISYLSMFCCRLPVVILHIIGGGHFYACEQPLVPPNTGSG